MLRTRTSSRSNVGSTRTSTRSNVGMQKSNRMIALILYSVKELQEGPKFSTYTPVNINVLSKMDRLRGGIFGLRYLLLRLGSFADRSCAVCFGIGNLGPDQGVGTDATF